MNIFAQNIQWHWILLLFNINWISTIESKEIRVVCYYTNWSVYRPGSAKFSPQNINPYLCTHLIYAFGGFTKDNILKPFDKYQDIEKGGYAKFTGLKTYNKNLKTMLAIGGWNEGSSKFSPLVASPDRRKELVKNVVKFLRQNHFDGLDLDWEYPSFRDGGKSRDRDNYAQFVQELREEFERESEKTGRTRLLLTMAVPAGIEYINKGYDVPKLTKYLDWMNILSYDYHSAFEPAVNHHAPLYPLEEESEYNYDTELNIDYTIKHYLKSGADSRKLVLGIPTYGRSYTLFNPDSADIGAPADGPGDMGDATRENGYLAYYEICEYVKSNEWTVVQPNDDAMGPFAYKDNQWVGYDDEAIVRRKSEYVAKNQLGGIMFWSIDNDDFRGSCHGKPYPLIEAAKEALIKAYGGNSGNQTSYPQKTRTRTRGRPPARSTTTEVSTYERDSSSRRKPSSSSTNRKKNGSSSRRRRPTTKATTETYFEERNNPGSSLLVTTPSYKTPEPPTTPDPGGDFKCEDEGFYPHPRDCKKYFWCLNGPSELGIVAHQFTCPSGLHFNKASSSCDYAQNVHCTKKPKATTTTTTTTEATVKSTQKASTTERSSTSSPLSYLFSTRRPAPKITAATSRTTFKATTSTTGEPEYEEEYEEYDDEDKGQDSEEDPQVIKELLNLIKKAGGIDQLEKQLKLHDNSSPSTGEKSSTKSSISKELVERVLKRTKSNEDRENNINNLKYNTINRNSRGPQNLGIAPEDEEPKQDRKYTTISRQRNNAQSTKVAGDEKPKSSRTQSIPEYVTIRRTRFSTTEANIIDDTDNDEELEAEDEDEDEEEVVNIRPEVSTRSSLLQYSSIRRSRPTTTESSQSSQSEIIDGKEELSSTSQSTTSKPSIYSNIRRTRPTTTTTTNTPTTTTTTTITTPTTTITTTTTTPVPVVEVTESTGLTTPKEIVLEVRSSIPVVEEQEEERITTGIPDNPTADTNTQPISESSSNTLTEVSSQSLTPTTKSPSQFIQLSKPRPFSFNSRVRSTTTTTSSPSTEASKVSPSSTTTPSQNTSSTVVNNNNALPLRSRGNSRYRTQTLRPQNIQKTSQTAQKAHLNLGKYEDERHYRPDIAQEISDLSSLTAFDFNFDGRNGNNNVRPRGGRRPVTVTPSTTSTVVASPRGVVSTRRRPVSVGNLAPRAGLPTVLQRRRLPTTTTTEAIVSKSVEDDSVDQPSESSTVQVTRRSTLPPLVRTTTEIDREVTDDLKEVPKEVTEVPKEVTEVRKEVTEVPKEVTEVPKEVTETPKDIVDTPNETTIREETVSSETTTTTTVKAFSKPTRRIIKVYRPHHRFSSTQLPKTTSETTEASKASKSEDDFISRPQNRFNYESPPATRKQTSPTPLYSRNNNNRFHHEEEEEEDAEEDGLEDENINLSETIRQENNDISGNSLSAGDDKVRKVIKRIRQSSTTSRPVEFTPFDKELRTRKFIRRLPSTTEETPREETRGVPLLSRTRKIVRRLSTTTTEIPREEEIVVSSTARNRLLIYSRSRPTSTTQRTTTLEVEVEDDDDEENTTLEEELLATEGYASTASSVRETSVEDDESTVSYDEDVASRTEGSTELVLESTTEDTVRSSTEENRKDTSTELYERFTNEILDDVNTKSTTELVDISSTESNAEGVTETSQQTITENSDKSTTESTSDLLTTEDSEETTTTTENNETTSTTTSRPSTSNYINNLIRNRVKTLEHETEKNNEVAVSIRPLKTTGVRSYFGKTRQESNKLLGEADDEEKTVLRPVNSLENREKPEFERKQTTGYRRNKFRPKFGSSTTTTTTRRIVEAREEEEDEDESKTEVKKFTTSSYRRKPYKFRSTTTTRSRTTKVTKVELEDKDLDEEVDDEVLEATEPSVVTNTKSSTTESHNLASTRTRYRPSSTTIATIENVPEEKVSEEANNKRKQLFNRDRVMNTPYYASSVTSTSTSTSTTEASDINTISYEVTENINTATTEKPTTLHHIFAQTEPMQTTSESTDFDSSDNPDDKKVERLISVSRIVNTGQVEELPQVVDKIGEISRITSINIVEDGVNNTESKFIQTVNGPVYSGRQDKKYEGSSKSSPSGGNVITIDGKSSVNSNSITARPFTRNEASTIALEGLFNTESSPSEVQYKTEELDVSGNQSPLVKIRVLEQDNGDVLAQRVGGKETIPVVRILSEESITMRANVVEVKPRNSQEIIKIAPITFEKQIKAVD